MQSIPKSGAPIIRRIGILEIINYRNKGGAENESSAILMALAGGGQPALMPDARHL